jgi:EH domain-containing protein 1
MLDSITERDRGYNYQDVIGDLAQIADLVLVLFDPHKAGTVREAHTSLRDTLPPRHSKTGCYTCSTASTNAPP